MTTGGSPRLTGEEVLAIYAKFGKIEGSVCAKGYENHIEWEKLSFYSDRRVSMEVGIHGEREADKPFISGVSLSKKMDKASPYFFTSALAGKAIDKVEIKCVKTSEDAIEEYLTYVLEDVLVSDYMFAGVEEEGEPTEHVSLAYNKIEMKYRPRKEDNSLGSPIPGGYDVKFGKKI